MRYLSNTGTMTIIFMSTENRIKTDNYLWRNTVNCPIKRYYNIIEKWYIKRSEKNTYIYIYRFKTRKYFYTVMKQKKTLKQTAFIGFNPNYVIIEGWQFFKSWPQNHLNTLERIKIVCLFVMEF